MSRILRVMGIFILGFGIFAFIQTGPLYADSMAIDFLYQAKFVYRLTPANQWIRPSPISLRFSRADSGPFCSKVVEVGVNTGSKSFAPGVGPAPGIILDPAAVLYASPISGGPLCNFNLNDDQVFLAVPPWKEEIFRQACSAVIKEFPCADPGTVDSPAPLRRRERVEHGFVDFKVYIKKNGGEYEWRTPARLAGNTSGIGPSDKIPVDLIYEAIPNRPPVLESVTLSPGSLTAGGGTIKITVVANDDVGVHSLGVAPWIMFQGSILPQNEKIFLKRTAGLGRTATGDNRSQWEGTFTVPQNIYCSGRNISSALFLEDGEGGVTSMDWSKVKLVPVNQAGYIDYVKPQILAYTVTPQALAAAGGPVTVKVTTKVKCNANNVMLTITRSDGWTTKWQMSRTNEPYKEIGEWSSQWNMWANTGRTQLVYGLTATISNNSGQTVTSQSIPITVEGITLQSIQPQSSGQVMPQAQPSSPAIGPGGANILTRPLNPPLK